MCGKSIPEIMKLWLDETRWQNYEKTNPESVLCYIRAAFHNRERMLDVVKLAKKVVMVKDKVNAGQYHLVTK